MLVLINHKGTKTQMLFLTWCLCAFVVNSVFLDARNTQTRNTKRQVHISQDPTLCAQQPSENSIQRRHVDTVLGLRFYPRQPHQFSYEQDRQEQGDVRVCGPFDLESSLLEHAPELWQTITAGVVADFILQAPK